MPALSFPNNPVDGQRYPANPGADGKCQYEFVAAKGVWNVVDVSVRTNNQAAFNSYDWPGEAPLEDGFQLIGDTDGTLTWGPGAKPVALSLGLKETFNGIRTVFSLVETETGNDFMPDPPTNIVIFLGGVPQIPGPGAAYTVIDNEIVFTEAPALGTVFYGFSLVKG